jgi:SAM-dependent methyltransferase
VSLRFHEIAEASHRILNPFTDGKLALLGAIAEVGEGTRILDLACGKGEMICTWAARHGARGIGVDLSAVFLHAAAERAEQLGVADRISLVEADASTYAADPAVFDVVACLGATWIGGGLAGTLDLLRPAVRPGGLILVGEPYWIDPPPDEAPVALGLAPGDFVSLAATHDRLEAAGMELVEMVLADGDSWDRYEASQWRTIDAWLAANPDDPDHAAMRNFLDSNRRAYLTWGRRYLGWGVFVLRPR